MIFPFSISSFNILSKSNPNLSIFQEISCITEYFSQTLQLIFLNLHIVIKLYIN